MDIVLKTQIEVIERMRADLRTILDPNRQKQVETFWKRADILAIATECKPKQIVAFERQLSQENRSPRQIKAYIAEITAIYPELNS